MLFVIVHKSGQEKEIREPKEQESSSSIVLAISPKARTHSFLKEPPT